MKQHLLDTAFLDETFNQKFDTKTGEETVSLWVTRRRQAAFFVALKEPEGFHDAKEKLARFACAWIGRVADTARCTDLGVKQHIDGRIEIRLRFGPPWYWSLINGVPEPAETHAGDRV